MSEKPFDKRKKAHGELVSMTMCEHCLGRRPQDSRCIDCGFDGSIRWLADRLRQLEQRINDLSRDTPFRIGGSDE